MNLYFMLNINLQDFDIVGVRQSENNDILIVVSCKKCGSTKEIRLKEDKINTISCTNCSKRNYIVYIVKDESIADVLVLNRSEYLKYYNSSDNKDPKELYNGLVYYLEHKNE